MGNEIYGQYTCPKCGETMSLTQDNIVKHRMFCKPVEEEAPMDRMFNSDEWVQAQRDEIGMDDTIKDKEDESKQS